MNDVKPTIVAYSCLIVGVTSRKKDTIAVVVY